MLSLHKLLSVRCSAARAVWAGNVHTCHTPRLYSTDEQPKECKQQDQQQQQQQGQKQQQQSDQQQEQQQQTQQHTNDQQPHEKVEGPGGLLADWRTTSAAWYDKGLSSIVRYHVDYPQLSTWSYLYQHKPPGLLRRLIFPNGCSPMTPILSWEYSGPRTVAEHLLKEAHADFDAESFRTGAKQALEYTTSLYAASDWSVLKPLVSAALLQSMRTVRQEQAELIEAYGATADDVELDIDADSVQIVCAHSITRNQLAALDEQRASEQLPLIPVAADDEESATVDADAAAAAAAACGAAASPIAEGAADQCAWDVAHVYAEGRLHAAVTQEGASASQRVSWPKSGHFVLCRGPVYVDRILTEDLGAEKPWFLLSWL